MPFMVDVSVTLSGVPLENDCVYQSPKKKTTPAASQIPASSILLNLKRP